MVRTQPVIGLTGQVVLLVILAMTTDLGAVGWAAGLSYAVVTCLALSGGLAQAGSPRLGPADWVTLARASLVGAVAALVVNSFRDPVPVPLLVGIAVLALVLDAVDGLVARRTRTESRLGARFDMEVDAFLILVLSVSVARTLGPWVLAIGVMRYAFLVAGWVLPWLRGPVPPRYWRKVVAAIQGIVLTAAVSGLFPAPLTGLAVAVALALLLESFGRDLVWLWNRRPAAQPDRDDRPAGWRS